MKYMAKSVRVYTTNFNDNRYLLEDSVWTPVIIQQHQFGSCLFVIEEVLKQKN